MSYNKPKFSSVFFHSITTSPPAWGDVCASVRFAAAVAVHAAPAKLAQEPAAGGPPPGIPRGGVRRLLLLLRAHVSCRAGTTLCRSGFAHRLVLINVWRRRIYTSLKREKTTQQQPPPISRAPTEYRREPRRGAPATSFAAQTDQQQRTRQHPRRRS